MSSEENVMRFRELIEDGFGRGDLSVVDKIVAPEAIEHQRGLKPGAEGVKDTIRTLRRWFPDLELTVEDLVADRDMVWARNRARGTNGGSIMGRPPTGGRIEIDVFDVARFEAGRIVEHWGVPDQLGMMQQLGLVPAPPAAARNAQNP